MLSFNEITARLAPAVETALDRYAQLGEGCPERLREAMRYSLFAPGKRMRPMLVLLAAEACDGQIEAALPAAAAVEMIHAYSLIHDDLPAMDDDDLRRGRPTCHKAFDEATAILAGDALIALAFETLAKHIQPLAAAAACCATLAEASGPCRLVGGQMDDILHSSPAPNPQPPSPFEFLQSIHRRKTGALITASTRLGGLAVGANAETLDRLTTYGECIGLAFQIVDDLLDVRSDSSTLGKQVGKDAKQGKLTFPGLLGLDQSAQYAAQLIEDACNAILPLGDRAAGLEALARFVLERNR